MAGEKPFSKRVRLALWVPLALMILAFVLWYIPGLRRVAGPIHIVAFVTNLLAVPYATWLLVTDAGYRNAKNIGLAVVAAIPLVWAAAMVVAYRDQIFR